MKFPETKPHSPFYRLLLPLVEQSPRPLLSPVPEVQRPGPGLFVQMGLRNVPKKGASKQEPGRGWRLPWDPGVLEGV